MGKPRVLAVSSWAGSYLSVKGAVSPVLAFLNVSVLLRTTVLSWALRSAKLVMAERAGPCHVLQATLWHLVFLVLPSVFTVGDVEQKAVLLAPAILLSVATLDVRVYGGDQNVSKYLSLFRCGC